MNKKKGHHQPLLYIQQPALAPSAASMQQVYLSSSPPVQKSAKRNVKSGLQVEPLAFVEEDNLSEIKEEDTVKPEAQEAVEKNVQKEQLKQGLTRVKPFKEMDINGRIAYLVPFIGRKAPFRCRFVLKNGDEITGVLSNENEHCITILTAQTEEISVEKSELAAVLIR